MTLTKTNKAVLNVLRKSRGRFLGLTTNNGTQINAQLIKETDKYVVIYDRNARFDRRIAKSNLSRARCGDLVAG